MTKFFKWCFDRNTPVAVQFFVATMIGMTVTLAILLTAIGIWQPLAAMIGYGCYRTWQEYQKDQRK